MVASQHGLLQQVGEAEPLANIKDMDAKRFFWKNIVTRFGIPHTLISDNKL